MGKLAFRVALNSPTDCFVDVTSILIGTVLIGETVTEGWIGFGVTVGWRVGRAVGAMSRVEVVAGALEECVVDGTRTVGIEMGFWVEHADIMNKRQKRRRILRMDCS
jgi:hypothetical protein